MSPSVHTRRRLFPLVRIVPGASDYPTSIASTGIQRPLHLIGEPGLLKSPALALFCSVKCPGAVIMETYEAMQRLKLQDRVIAGGFHSPMERTCMDILMRGRAKLILCPARGLRRLRVRPEWYSLLAENRILIISPFDDSIRRSTIQLGCARNNFVASLAEWLLIPYAARTSRTERFAVEMLSQGKTVYTFPGPDSRLLTDLGAKPLPL